MEKRNAGSKNIEASLAMYLYEKQHSPISSHFKGQGLSECDVISVSKSDYIYEYEVKISRSDFKADFKKDKHKLMTEGLGYKENKGDVWYLTSNYFYFVVPTNLISIDEVPEYAGLMYMNEDLQFEVIKKAPLIHKIKATPKFIRQLSHNLTCKLVFKKIE